MVDADILALYRGLSLRVVELVSSDPTASIPACPEWNAQQVLAHVTSVAEDWAAHRIDAYGSDAWAAAGVARLAGASVDQLGQRWTTAIDAMAELDDEPGMGDPVRWAFGDAAVHEADLRGALAPGTTLPAPALEAASDTAWAMFRSSLKRNGAPPLVVRLGDGSELRHGDTDADAVELRVSRHEMFRALQARRSADQVRSYHWSGDPEPFLQAGLIGPNIPAGRTGLASWPTDDLIETPID